MIICILASNENIDVVRERAKQILQFATHAALTVPVSEYGEMPATHWFCTFNASEEVFQQIKDLQEFSEVAEADPRTFLKEHNLKIISFKKVIADKKSKKKEES